MAGTIQINLNQPFRLGAWTIYPESGEMKLPTGKSVILRRLEMDVLLYLSSRSGKMVSAGEILEHVWSGISVNEEAVYHYISKLRQALGQDSGAQPYIQTMPKRGYRLIAGVSAVGDDAPERGPVFETGAALSASGAAPAGRGDAKRLPAVAAFIALLGGALRVFAIAGSDGPPGATVTPPQPAGASIAVLPFADLSSDPEQQYFADGISEELLNMLAKLPDLKVISRSSSFAFSEPDVDILSVAAKLQVNHILDGSVRHDGNRVRVTAQLIDAGNGAHIWSETYERELTDIFAVQDEISTAIADALQISLGVAPGAPPPAPGLRAYDLFLKGRALLATRNPQEIRQAADLFAETIALAPDYADAHAMLAMARLVEYAKTSGGRTPERLRPLSKSRELAEKALSLDPGNVTALTVLGGFHMLNLNLERSEVYFLKALEISPASAAANNWYGDILSETLRLDEALEMKKMAVEVEPLLSNNHFELAGVYAQAGRGEKALASYEKALELDPGQPAVNNWYMLTLFKFGKSEKLKRVIALDMEMDPSLADHALRPFWEALARGDKAGALAVLNSMEESWKVEGSSYRIAVLQAMLGEYEKAAEALVPWSRNFSFIASITEAFPSDPEILAANPTYAAMWRSPPLDRMLRARGHWVEPAVATDD